jgi:hypothetical protein
MHVHIVCSLYHDLQDKACMPFTIWIVIRIEPNSTSKNMAQASKGRIAKSYISPQTRFIMPYVGLQVGFMNPSLHMEIINKSVPP